MTRCYPLFQSFFLHFLNCFCCHLSSKCHLWEFPIIFHFLFFWFSIIIIIGFFFSCQLDKWTVKVKVKKKPIKIIWGSSLFVYDDGNKCMIVIFEKFKFSFFLLWFSWSRESFFFSWINSFDLIIIDFWSRNDNKQEMSLVTV